MCEFRDIFQRLAQNKRLPVLRESPKGLVLMRAKTISRAARVPSETRARQKNMSNIAN